MNRRAIYTSLSNTILVLCFSLGVVLLSAEAQAALRVGIYDNPPKVYLDLYNKPTGITVDILDAIARKEGWAIEYSMGTWTGNLDRLECGELDIVVDMSYSPERAEKYEMNNVPVIESWVQVYAKKENLVQSVHELEGKRIAVLRGSVQHEYFEQHARLDFDINYQLWDYADYLQTIDALDSGAVDVIAASRFFFFSPQRSDDIIPTPVVLLPAYVYYAFGKSDNSRLIAAIDRNLADMKNDPDSEYYHILAKYFISKKTLMFSPVMKRWIIILTISAAFLFLLVVYLRYRIKQKTNQLKLRNIELEATRNRLQNALKESESRGEKLSGLLEEKENLVRELFHRTRNNMQIISAILNLQAKKNEDVNVRRGYLDAIKRIQSMALVYDLLFQTTKLSRIDLDVYIRQLALQCKDSSGIETEKVELEFNLAPVSVLFDYAVPCGLVVNELLANSFSHAFPGGYDNAKICIELYMPVDNQLQIIYRDNGCGLKDMTSVDRNDNIGFNLIQGIVENQLKGSVVFGDRQEGFYCEIVFSDSGYKERV